MHCITPLTALIYLGPGLSFRVHNSPVPVGARQLRRPKHHHLVIRFAVVSIVLLALTLHLLLAPELSHSLLGSTRCGLWFAQSQAHGPDNQR